MVSCRKGLKRAQLRGQRQDDLEARHGELLEGLKLAQLRGHRREDHAPPQG